MKSLSHYFDPAQKAAFERELPRIYTEIAVLSFSERSSRHGVAGETFRAYTGWANRPSDIYREWADEICSRLELKSLKSNLKSRQTFLRWHTELSTSLQHHWHLREGRKLSFAHLHKLVDLFVKWLSRHQFDRPAIRDGFIKYANCALDRQTLKMLNTCLSYALPMPAPSMGHILGRPTYEFVQDTIAAFSSHCGATPLLFDFYAWKKGG